MSLHYGYLQGTFGLPYGGYCVRPPHLGDVTLDADNEHLRMFCVLGQFGKVQEWLEEHDLMVCNECTVHCTFLHDLIVEVYSKASFLERLFKGQDGIDVQLVIRIARTWDRRKDTSSQFKPMLKAIVPSGISFPEIRDVLRRAVPGVVFDTTSNKVLVNVVLSRVTTRCSELGQRRYLSMSPSPERAGLLLPAYESSDEPPPEYSRNAGPHQIPD